VAKGESVVRVWDLDTRQVRVLDAGDGRPIASCDFLPDGRLLTPGPAGVRVWDLQSGNSNLILKGAAVLARPSPDGRYLLVFRGEVRPGGAVGTAFVHDLRDNRSWDLTSHGTQITNLAWHPSGTQVVTSSLDGIVRVGPLTGEEPHLLIGHEAAVWDLEVEPNGRLIVSAGNDGTVRMWPVPEGRPLHTLPHRELLEHLRSLTNVRVVSDIQSPGGYRLTFEPFSGWNRTPPSW
jgi:WD40 repeat protein